MPQLFDVPGWSVPEPPKGGGKSDKGSKKRKRPTSDTSSKLLSAEFNLEKLMDKLKESTKLRDESRAAKSNNSDEKKNKKNKKLADQQRWGEGSREISLPKPLQATRRLPKHAKDRAKPIQGSPSRPAKRVKTSHVIEDPPRNRETPAADKNLTALQKSMKQSLDGAKFRMINETLYKSDSQAALRMMQEDPTVYDEYHTGFRRQVQAWPTNPVDQYISKLKQCPPKTVIADLGCGDAALARGLLPEGMNVLSFDLIADGMYVVEADACKKIPLPGSEPSEESTVGEGQVVDVTVCSLSLMSTNWPACIREAWRILKPDGELQIAEVASRFTNVKEFENLVCSIGFHLKEKDDRNTHFTLFEFKKIARKAYGEKEWSKVLGKVSILKPCEYKRR